MNSNSQPWILTEVHQRHDELVAAARNESLAREFVQARRNTRNGSPKERTGWLRRLLGLAPRTDRKPAGTSSPTTIKPTAKTPGARATTGGTAKAARGGSRPALSRPRDARLVGR